ncbi:hypothetical protein [Prevotella sp. HUN102]|uniref:hypothetical protein n=1 Tax=Prevotella sp. HUN102 TaxID=1392486 RepID=UPI000A8DE3C5|nr:hypothetical protein [Prevotella sp. HUN102]
MTNLKNWLAKTNEPFSLLGGENFTNKEVILAHVGIIIMVATCCLAEWINNF